jgi:hypothetical protein
VKTTHDTIDKGTPMEKHRITVEGGAREFDLIVDALSNHSDERVQKMAAYIRKSVGTGR